MKTYKEYKDSGVDWIGRVPFEWKVSHLKFNCNIQGRVGYKGYTVGDLVSAGEGPYTLGAKHISKKNKLDLSSPEYISWEKYYESPEIMVYEGDLLLTQRGTLGKVVLIEGNIGEATINPSMVLLNKLTCSAKYLYYFFNSDYFSKWIDLSNTATAVPMITQEQLGNFKILVPTIEEQIKIGQYLELKTAQLDKLINDKEKLINLLKEERTAIIHRAITKGLDSALPTKDSGIEWLGKIPQHWKVKKLKFVAKINQSSLTENTPEDYELEYIDIGGVSAEGKISETQSYRFKDAPSRARRIVKKGDIIVSTVRTYLKAIAQIQGDELNLVASTGFAVVEAEEELNNDFLYHLIKSEKFIDTICSVSRGVSYPSVTGSDILNLPIWYPPMGEQLKIVEHLKSEEGRIVNICVKLNKEIECLKEYKTALISEVVTGKINVQGEVMSKSLLTA